MSLWEKDIMMKSYDPLKENKVVDILIVGGGMTGINSLYFLKDQKNVMLVEANKIGQGVSLNTTGKINYLQESTLGHLILTKQYTKAKIYLASQIEGIKLLKKIIKMEQIECNLEEVTSYLVTQKAEKVQDIKQIEHFLEDIKIPLENDLSLLDKDFLYGIGVKDTFVFHPLKYLKGLLNVIKHPIYEHTRIMNIRKTQNGYQCVTDQGYYIEAKRVMIACHYPFFYLPYFLPTKTSIEKSYLNAYKVKENKKYTYITIENPSLSTRFYEDNQHIYQLALGGSHKTSVKQNDSEQFQKITTSKLKNILWSNVDICTFDHMPIIGPIKENLYLATGYQAWGMIQSVISAQMFYQSINGKHSPYDDLFSPHRIFIKRFLFSFPYLLSNAYSFLRSKWYHKSWYSNHLTFSYKKGRLIACYKDKNGEKHLVHPVCPHMKCGLIFNEIEETWDCPCHSSRFDKDGNIIKGPSKYSIQWSENSD